MSFSLMTVGTKAIVNKTQSNKTKCLKTRENPQINKETYPFYDHNKTL